MAAQVEPLFAPEMNCYTTDDTPIVNSAAWSGDGDMERHFCLLERTSQTPMSIVCSIPLSTQV